MFTIFKIFFMKVLLYLIWFYNIISEWNLASSWLKLLSQNSEINPLSLLLTTHPQMALSTLSKHIRHSISLLIVFIDVILHVKSGQILFFCYVNCTFYFMKTKSSIIFAFLLLFKLYLFFS